MVRLTSLKLTPGRNLFPDVCFGQRNYTAVPRDVHCSYKSFVDDNLPFGESLAVIYRSKETGPRPLMVLLRGKTPQVDKLLEWLVGLGAVPAKPLSLIIFRMESSMPCIRAYSQLSDSVSLQTKRILPMLSKRTLSPSRTPATSKQWAADLQG